MSGRQTENARAERVALAISLAVVLGVLAAIGSQLVAQGPDDARFTLTVAGSRAEGDAHHLRVRVRNEGGRTAENVQVLATLTVPGKEPVEGEQIVQFLAGAAEDEVVFVFGDDPAEGELELRVGSYTIP